MHTRARAHTILYPIKRARAHPSCNAEHWNRFSEAQRVEIRNYILSLLATKGPRLPAYASSGLISLLCRVTKFAWFDEGDAIRQIVPAVTEFLQVGEDAHPLFLRTLMLLRVCLCRLRYTTVSSVSRYSTRSLAR
jgi:hypothetical protein